MSTPTKISPLRHLVNTLSDAVARIDEKYESANLEFPALDKPFDEKHSACRLLSDPDVVPLSSVIVAAADQLIASSRHPMQAILDMAHSVSPRYPLSSHIRSCGLLIFLTSTLLLRALDWHVKQTSRRSCARLGRRLVLVSPSFLLDLCF